jgi:hypothetical protein
VSVFLRWGIFGILGVAALLYAYNASKRLAERHAQQTPPAAQIAHSPAPAAGAPPEVAPEPSVPAAPRVEAAPPAPAHCETELNIARRAIDARRGGEPLDRVLRIQEIAFESSPTRRARLEKVATRYFNYEGEFQPEALRIAVISDCMQATP